MKALLLNGTRKGEASLDAAHRIICKELQASGWRVDTVVLRDEKIAWCTGCFGCWVKTPGICVIDDAGREVARRIIRSDLLVLLTSVTFGGYSSELKKALDRIIPLVLPFFMKIDGEVHHRPRYERYPSLVGVGLLPHPDEKSGEIFRTLVSRNAINFHSPYHSAGVITADSSEAAVRAEVRKLLSIAEVR